MHKYFSKKSRMKFHQIENNIIDNKVTADVPKGTTLAGKWLLIIKGPNTKYCTKNIKKHDYLNCPPFLYRGQNPKNS